MIVVNSYQIELLFSPRHPPLPPPTGDVILASSLTAAAVGTKDSPRRGGLFFTRESLAESESSAPLDIVVGLLRLSFLIAAIRGRERLKERKATIHHPIPYPYPIPRL